MKLLMPNPTSDEILSALNRTGFMLEYRVAQALRNKGFSTDINHAYPDPESGKSREIDVSASLDRDIERQPVSLNVGVGLVIECKSGLNPFVLIGERNQNPVGFDDSIFLSFDPYTLEFEDRVYERIKYDLEFDELPGSWRKEDFVGYQIIRMNQQNGNWKADNNSIYDSILYPLAKAWQYTIDRHYPDDDNEEDKAAQWQYPGLTYTFPIIVTAGPVFIVDVTEDQATVKEVGWASLKRDFSSTELSVDLRVDVVSFDHFAEYLDSRILRITNSALDVLKANIHLFDPEWLLANLGEPKHKEFFDTWLNYVRTHRKS
jgi:hypothetical protein